MTRWIRRTLRNRGIELPFKSMVCTEQVKQIRVDTNWRATVTVQNTLVFLDVPEEGDLCDVLPLEARDYESVIHGSPDARELARRQQGDTMRVYWAPKEAIVRYATYVHQYSWTTPGWDGQASLYTEYSCSMKTGVQYLEVIAPITFVAAVAFKRPRWSRLNNERSLMKYALDRMESPEGSRPTIRDNGQRVQWQFIGPEVGDRYVCMAFTADALAQWQEKLQKVTMGDRIRGLLRMERPA